MTSFTQQQPHPAQQVENTPSNHPVGHHPGLPPRWLQRASPRPAPCGCTPNPVPTLCDAALLGDTLPFPKTLCLNCASGSPGQIPSPQPPMFQGAQFKGHIMVLVPVVVTLHYSSEGPSSSLSCRASNQQGRQQAHPSPQCKVAEMFPRPPCCRQGPGVLWCRCTPNLWKTSARVSVLCVHNDQGVKETGDKRTEGTEDTCFL